MSRSIGSGQMWPIANWLISLISSISAIIIRWPNYRSWRGNDIAIVWWHYWRCRCFTEQTLLRISKFIFINKRQTRLHWQMIRIQKWNTIKLIHSWIDSDWQRKLCTNLSDNRQDKFVSSWSELHNVVFHGRKKLVNTAVWVKHEFEECATRDVNETLHDETETRLRRPCHETRPRRLRNAFRNVRDQDVHVTRLRRWPRRSNY